MTEWNAAEYAQVSSLQETMAREILAHLDFEGARRILDVGCGDGKVTAQIARRAPQSAIIGVDPSHEMIEFARTHHGSIRTLRFEVADARQLPFDNEFDLVVSFNALHWIPEQELALRSIHLSLAVDGKAQLRLVPAGPRKSLELVVEETRQRARWREYFENFSDPYLRLSPEEYSTLAERCGFRVLNLSTNDHSWDFQSRGAFADFSAVGCVAWTTRLPQAQRMNFINDALDRYREVTGSDRIFKFYQMDIALLRI